MNKYCIALNLDLKIFNSDLHPVDAIKTLPSWSDDKFKRPSGNKHLRVPREFLNQDFIDFFKNQGIHLIGVEVFYTVPNGSNIIHSDVTTLADVAKINWVYGGEGSFMEWFNVNSNYSYDKKSNRDNNTALINSPTMLFLKSEVDLVHTQHVESPSIVQVGCPHNMKNYGPTERFCISTIFESIELGRRITIAEANEIFKEFLVGALT